MENCLAELRVSASTATPVKGVRLAGPPFVGSVVEDLVALESPVNLYINDAHFLTLFATPHELRDLAVGHLLGEGIIDRTEEVVGVTVDGTDVLLRVEKTDLAQRLEQHKHIKMIYSSCGSIDDYLKILDRINKPRVTSRFTVDAEKVAGMLRELSRGAGSFKHSVAVHTAALYADDRLMHRVEDVSRHVTVDKVIGKAGLAGTNFGQSALLTTGRQASDMILKAARVGVPITVSLRGPLFSGVYSAQKTGVTLVSITRGKGITVYTHPQRIQVTRRGEAAT